MSDSAPAITDASSRVRGAAVLTASNAVLALGGLVTGTILARTLGPAGRGALAAVLVPFFFAPGVLGLGLPTYALRATARGEHLGRLIGTLSALSLAAGAVGFAGMVVLAPVLADKRESIERLLLVGFSIMPLVLVAMVLQSTAWGLERWVSLGASRVVPSGVGVLGLTVLAAVGGVAVTPAAAVTFAGAIAPLLLLSLVLRSDLRRLSVSLQAAREALSFGVRAWTGSLASLANNRLDQLVMIPSVSARELGLYVIAVTVAGLSIIFVGALVSTLGPRMARGDVPALERTLRIAILLVTGFHAVLAALVPVAIPRLFGEAFRDAVPMAIVLLAAGVPGVVGFVLTGALTNAGHPTVTTLAECCALIVTVPGLALVLGPYGGVGAACVSLAAYLTSSAILVGATRHYLGVPISRLIVPRPGDVVTVARGLGSLLVDLHRG